MNTEITTTEIITALQEWSNRHPDPQVVFAQTAGKNLSPNQLVLGVEQETDMGKEFFKAVNMMAARWPEMDSSGVLKFLANGRDGLL